MTPGVETSPPGHGAFHRSGVHDAGQGFFCEPLWVVAGPVDCDARWKLNNGAALAEDILTNAAEVKVAAKGAA